MHQKVLKINIRPSYNSENTVFIHNNGNSLNLTSTYFRCEWGINSYVITRIVLFVFTNKTIRKIGWDCRKLWFRAAISHK